MSGEVLEIELDRSSPVPLYFQVATAIESAIQSGALAPGDPLENEVSLAARLGISRPTARQALQGLVDRGLLVRKRGVGTQVAPLRIRRNVGLTSLHDDLQRAGRTSSATILSYEVRPADVEMARQLELPEGDDVVHLSRLRFADGEPLALMTNYIPAEFAPSAEDLSEGRGLYEALRARGKHPHIARQRIGARLTRASESRLLDEPPRSPVLTMQRTAYDAGGRVIEVGDHVYRGSRYVFDTTLFAR